MRNTVIGLGALIVLLALALFIIPAPERSGTEDDFVVFQEETRDTQIIIEYPVLDNKVAAARLTAIVDGYIADFNNTAKDIGPSSIGKPYLLIIEDVDFAETEKTEGVLLLMYQDFGSAHGISRLIGINFYKKTGETVSLEGVLDIGGKNLNSLSEEATVFFEEKLGEGFIKEGAEVADKNFESFFVKNNEIVFFFEASQVAVQALGPQEYTISY
ncbi:hypothetical protein COB87_000185 [Candidatus Wolfebacteria bacterium]|nr:hypothetical protein [Candidatus Wolfebacteria bacterium]